MEPTTKTLDLSETEIQVLCGELQNKIKNLIWEYQSKTNNTYIFELGLVEIHPKYNIVPIRTFHSLKDWNDYFNKG